MAIQDLSKMFGLLILKKERKKERNIFILPKKY